MNDEEKLKFFKTEVLQVKPTGNRSWIDIGLLYFQLSILSCELHVAAANWTGTQNNKTLSNKTESKNTINRNVLI